jgi:REP element-mobilizing transposase RayT
MKRLSGFYFAEVLGFSILGNHFHLLVRMHPESSYSEEEVRERYDRRYGREKAAVLSDDQMGDIARKMADLSEYVKEIKQGFSRYYNKRHRKKGYFWSERFTLLNSLRALGDVLRLCAAKWSRQQLLCRVH